MGELNEQYALAISSAIMSLFDEENENCTYDIEQTDATEFFIGLVKAGALVFNRFTTANKNLLEFTHLANQLIVQDMVTARERAAEDKIDRLENELRMLQDYINRGCKP